jgi:hemerythrin
MVGLDYIVWNESCETGLPAIDHQHKIIVRVINDLHRVRQTQIRRRQVDQLALRLKSYTELHFAFEEHLLEERGYPELAAHLMEHRLLADRTRDFYSHVPHHLDEVAEEMLTFLRDWWKHHICTDDMKYVRFFETGTTAGASG